MTTRQLEHIRQRRELLVARADLQRLDLALSAHAWQKPLAVVDRGVALVRRVRGHPAALLLVAAALMYLNRKQPGRLLSLGGIAWRAWRNLTHKKTKTL